jgi:hypothetical protein
MSPDLCMVAFEVLCYRHLTPPNDGSSLRPGSLVVVTGRTGKFTSKSGKPSTFASTVDAFEIISPELGRVWVTKRSVENFRPV